MVGNNTNSSQGVEDQAGQEDPELYDVYKVSKVKSLPSIFRLEYRVGYRVFYPLFSFDNSKLTVCHNYTSRSGLTFDRCYLYNYNNNSLKTIKGAFITPVQPIIQLSIRREFKTGFIKSKVYEEYEDAIQNVVLNVLVFLNLPSLRREGDPENYLVTANNSIITVYDKFIKPIKIALPVIANVGNLVIYKSPPPSQLQENQNNFIIDNFGDTKDQLWMYEYKIKIPSDSYIYKYEPADKGKGRLIKVKGDITILEATSNKEIMKITNLDGWYIAYISHVSS